MKTKDKPKKDGSLIKNGLLTIIAAVIVYPVVGLYISIAIAALGALMLVLEILIKFSDQSNSNSQ